MQVHQINGEATYHEDISGLNPTFQKLRKVYLRLAKEVQKLSTDNEKLIKEAREVDGHIKSYSRESKRYVKKADEYEKIRLEFIGGMEHNIETLLAETKKQNGELEDVLKDALVRLLRSHKGRDLIIWTVETAAWLDKREEEFKKKVQNFHRRLSRSLEVQINTTESARVLDLVWEDLCEEIKTFRQECREAFDEVLIDKGRYNYLVEPFDHLVLEGPLYTEEDWKGQEDERKLTEEEIECIEATASKMGLTLEDE